MSVSLQIRKFNDKVTVMNQSGSANMILSATEARNLLSEIVELLALLAENKENHTSDIRADGGQF